jgi:hypothetical protein
MRFAGIFECVSRKIIQGKSKREASRKTIVFDLTPAAAAVTASVKSPPLVDIAARTVVSGMSRSIGSLAALASSSVIDTLCTRHHLS